MNDSNLNNSSRNYSGLNDAHRDRSAANRLRCAAARSGPRRLMTELAVAIAAATTLAVSAATDLPCGSAGAGPCDTPHGGLGCTWNACCIAVCNFDPSCCDVAWSESCVLWSTELCADIPCPDEGACDAAHDGTGCDDEVCCFLVCRLDPFCCFGRWDAWCGIEATQLCGVAPCTIDVPADARPEIEECTERLNDGCNMAEPAFDAIACGDVVTGRVSSNAPRDTDWYAISLDRATTIAATLTSEFPGEVMVVDGTCSATRVHAMRSASGCAPGTLDIELPAGDWWIVVSLATEVRAIHRAMPCPDPKDPEAPLPAYGNRYVLGLECNDIGTPILGDLNGDGVVDGADLGLLLASWGPCVGCDADLNGDGVVDGADLGILLAFWSAP